MILTVGKKGKNPLEFNEPVGIAVHPLNKKVYIVESGNHHVQVLNSDLTYFSSLGRGNDLTDLLVDSCQA